MFDGVVLIIFSWFFVCVFFFSSRRRHTRLVSDWSSDVCSSDLGMVYVTSEEGAGTTFTVELPNEAKSYNQMNPNETADQENPPKKTPLPERDQR